MGLLIKFMKRPSISSELRAATYRSFLAEFYNTSVLILFIGWATYKTLISYLFPPQSLIFTEMCNGQNSLSNLLSKHIS